MAIYRGVGGASSTTSSANAEAVIQASEDAVAAAASAATSETNAAASAAAAANTYDDFDDRYLGAKASSPATDNDGDPLVAGALYFNTADQSMYVYDGSAWNTVLATNTSVESIALTSGQTSVVFSGSVAYAAFYITGPDVDNGRLLESVDYTVDVPTKTVTLTQSYPAGTTLTSLKNVSEAGDITSANSVSYNQGGTGAVTRTVEARLSDTVSVKDFGAVGDGVTDDTAAIQAALDSGAKKVRLPSGKYKITSTLNLPTNVCIQGDGMGHGSFSNTRLSAYHTSGAVVQFNGYYSELRDIELWYEGASKATVTGVNYTTVTRTYLENVTIFGFEKGITNSKTPTTFTHLHRNVYVKNCTIGIDLQYVNNVVFDACFIESNGTNLKVDVFTNVVLCNGTVIEIFGDERLSETTSSVCLQVSNGYNFVCRDCYFEVGTLAGAGTTLKAATVFSTHGFIFESNYINRSAENQAPMILFTDGGSSAVSVKNNYFLRGPSTGTDYFVKGDTGFEDVVYGFEVSNNAVKSTMVEKEVEFTPELLEAGAAIPGITYDIQEGSIMVHGGMCTVSFNISLTSNGTPVGGALTVPIPVTSFSGMGINNEIAGVLWCKNLTSAFTDFSVDIESGGTVLNLARDYTTSLQSTNLTATTDIRGTITFPLERQAI